MSRLIARLALVCCATVTNGACGGSSPSGVPGGATGHVAYSLTGRFDTSMFLSFRGGPNGTVIDDTTISIITDTINAVIDIDSLDSAPRGTMTIQRCGSCMGSTSAFCELPCGARSGDSVFMTLMAGGPERFNLRGIVGTDTISGTIEFLYITSAIRRNAGTFVARR